MQLRALTLRNAQETAVHVRAYDAYSSDNFGYSYGNGLNNSTRNLTVTKNTAFASGVGIYFESTPQFDIQSNGSRI